MVNSHAHSGMAVLRGVGDGLPLESWLDAVRGVEGQMTREDIYWSLQLALCEMIRNGTTGFADMFLWDETLIDSVAEAGIRLSAAPAIFGQHDIGWETAGGLPAAEQIVHIERLAETYADEPLLRIVYGPHAIYTCKDSVFSMVAERVRETGLGVHVHLSESMHEVNTCIEEYGVTPVQVADQTGLLTEKTIVAHGTWLTDLDLEILAKRGSTVSHNPQSNLKLGSGIAPVTRMLAHNVRVSLGTDGPASNDSLDMIRDMRLAASLQRGVNQQSDALSVKDCLAMATYNGSRALGFEGLTLEVGSPADLILVNAEGVRGLPLTSPSGYIGWCATGHDVTDVVVNGRILMRNQELLTIDEERVMYEVVKIKDRLGLRDS
ncbi:amidohydrolase [Paenarthrobacter sp. GOM3]|uniref:amidohydrolase n=1 Tax=Paenarthrobacter sp. GOM3 TaxID=2782567 RepID=UPI00295AEEA3|nr:amidohydrolase [Paenarthrobacter sp. GOM3]WOH20762.1 amidohydrolase [Paenarthrobacter sp. GOM3]